jgi:hypothetical protein
MKCRELLYSKSNGINFLTTYYCCSMCYTHHQPPFPYASLSSLGHIMAILQQANTIIKLDCLHIVAKLYAHTYRMIVGASSCRLPVNLHLASTIRRHCLSGQSICPQYLLLPSAFSAFGELLSFVFLSLFGLLSQLTLSELIMFGSHTTACNRGQRAVVNSRPLLLDAAVEQWESASLCACEMRTLMFRRAVFMICSSVLMHGV